MRLSFSDFMMMASFVLPAWKSCARRCAKSEVSSATPTRRRRGHARNSAHLTFGRLYWHCDYPLSINFCARTSSEMLAAICRGQMHFFVSKMSTHLSSFMISLHWTLFTVRSWICWIGICPVHCGTKWSARLDQLISSTYICLMKWHHGIAWNRRAMKVPLSRAMFVACSGARQVLQGSGGREEKGYHRSGREANLAHQYGSMISKNAIQYDKWQFQGY